MIKTSPQPPFLVLGTVTSLDPFQVLEDGGTESVDAILAGQHTFTVNERCIIASVNGTFYVLDTLIGLEGILSNEIIFDTTGGDLLVYAVSGPTVTTITAAGAGTWTAPIGITTVKVEAWGAGGGASGGAGLGTYGGVGGCGGEYAREDFYTVVPGSVYAYNIGTGGAGAAAAGPTGGTGGDTTFDNGGVTANGGSGAFYAFQVHGGTGSTDSVHFNGGDNSVTGGGFQAGAGGGGSAGSNAAGHPGNSPTGNTSPGAGGAAVSGGGKGGAGGINTANGQNGSAPGGGGGGGGGGTGSGGHAGGSGANGQLRITYGGSVVLIGSIASVAGQDQYGTAYASGIRTNPAPSVSGMGGGYYERLLRITTTQSMNSGDTLVLNSSNKLLGDFVTAYNTSTGLWTCPVDGDYLWTLVFTTATTAITRTSINYLKNGAAYFSDEKDWVTGGAVRACSTANDWFNAGDTLSVQITIAGTVPMVVAVGAFMSIIKQA